GALPRAEPRSHAALPGHARPPGVLARRPPPPGPRGRAARHAPRRGALRPPPPGGRARGGGRALPSVPQGPLPGADDPQAPPAPDDPPLRGGRRSRLPARGAPPPLAARARAGDAAVERHGSALHALRPRPRLLRGPGGPDPRRPRDRDGGGGALLPRG